MVTSTWRFTIGRTWNPSRFSLNFYQNSRKNVAICETVAIDIAKSREIQGCTRCNSVNRSAAGLFFKEKRKTYFYIYTTRSDIVLSFPKFSSWSLSIGVKAFIFKVIKLELLYGDFVLAIHLEKIPRFFVQRISGDQITGTKLWWNFIRSSFMSLNFDQQTRASSTVWIS